MSHSIPRLWTIPEIVSMICANLRQRDHVRLVRVHSALWECVIHHVWEKVPRLLCLSRLIPRTNSEYVNVSPSLEERWARFDMYAKFIRELKVEFQGKDLKTLAALQTGWLQRLQSSDCPTSFAPCVKHLTVVFPAVQPAMDSVDGWALFFPSTLVSFNFTLTMAGCGETPDTNLVPCLEALRKKASDLQTLTLQVGHRFQLTESFSRILVKTIHEFNQLTALGLDFTPQIPEQLVKDIVSSSQLSHLYVGDMLKEGQDEEDPTWDVPSTLVALGLQGQPFLTNRFLKATNPATVTRLTIRDSEGWEYGHVLAELQRFTNLDELELDVAIQSFNNLHPLRNQLQNLVHLTLGPKVLESTAISSNTLPQLAVLLPKIEELRFVQFGYVGDLSTFVPLKALQCFATSCPHLRKLCIPVEIYYTLDTELATIRPHPTLQEIDMQQSSATPFADLNNAAETMAKMFPKLTAIAFIGSDVESDDSMMDTWGQLVDAVMRLLPKLEILALDDDEGTVGSFGDFFCDVVKVP
ncbi:hypothetical protein FRB90_008782 [Tulasnella sp. 427]|nr:hypothetical protein FRB90_008782 [Tulasnella sp. 427]